MKRVLLGVLLGVAIPVGAQTFSDYAVVHLESRINGLVDEINQMAASLDSLRSSHNALVGKYNGHVDSIYDEVRKIHSIQEEQRMLIVGLLDDRDRLRAEITRLKVPAKAAVRRK